MAKLHKVTMYLVDLDDEDCYKYKQKQLDSVEELSDYLEDMDEMCDLTKIVAESKCVPNECICWEQVRKLCVLKTADFVYKDFFEALNGGIR